MEAVVGLLVMLLGVSHGIETHCDGRQNGAQCYGALGGTVVLQLMDRNSEIHRYEWQKNKTLTILRVINNKIVSNVMENRSVFTLSNGTFRINNLSRTDAAEYTLKIFDSAGKRSEQRTLQLFIQAPVSSVLLASECLSQGEMSVSCSSKGGDSPQYSWTLDGHTLTDAQLLCGNKETNNIILKQDVSGLLVCSVRNLISSVSKEKEISTCGFIFINCTSSNGTNISQWVFSANNTLCIDPTTTPTTITETPASTLEGKLPVIAGVLSALVILLMVGVAVVCIQRKKQDNKSKEEDGQELTYATVNVKQQQRRQMHQRAETVEYDQVGFSGRPRQTVKPKEDQCVYATVRQST